MTDMPDDLRTRIAAALQARDEAATAGIADPLLVEHASYDELADAVIAELGLRKEAATFTDLPDHDTYTVHTNVKAHRYVTEWNANE